MDCESDHEEWDATKEQPQKTPSSNQPVQRKMMVYFYERRFVILYKYTSPSTQYILAIHDHYNIVIGKIVHYFLIQSKVLFIVVLYKMSCI